MGNPALITADLERTFRAIRNNDPRNIEKQNVPNHPDYPRVPSRNYAPTAVANTGNWGNGMSKYASNGIIYGQPQFFSPIHTPINWQLPSKKLEVYQWARFFFENEPKVAAAIDFYSFFPMSDWTHDCKDIKVKNYFDRFKKRLNLPKWARLISHEVHLLGDCYPMVEIDCPLCGGHSNGDEICEHEGGTVRRLVILNPDYVEVYTSPLSPVPIIALKPDEELINMVQKKLPGFEQLAPEVIKLVSSGQPIRLDNRNVAHLKYGESAYRTYGIGMVRRLFPILSYKTKLMVAQWIVAERLILPIKIVKVGSDERPAGPADIAAVQAQLSQTANDPNLTIVTHHNFELSFEGASGKILTLSNEFELINQEILDGLMINNALLNGEGPTFCLSVDTKILTSNGLKTKDELDIEKDMIATFNKETGSLEYQKAIKKYEYDWDSVNGKSPKMKRFLTNRIDMLVTPNHRMLCANRKLTTRPNGQKIDGQKEGYGDWSVVEASNVKVRSKFRASIDNWVGTTEDKEEYFGMKTDDFLRIVGWYASEGYRNHAIWKDGTEHINRVSFSQSPTANNKTYCKMYDLLLKNNLLKLSPSRQDVFILEKKSNEGLVNYLADNLGGKANSKHIPQDLKNLNCDRLKVLLEALVDGDGSERIATKKKPTDKKYYSYKTVSTQLRDDVIEILFKLGFSPRFIIIKFDNPNLQTQYVISWSENKRIGRFPTLDSTSWNNNSKKSIHKETIFDEDYIGKVWCVEVPNHFIVTERNGLFGIHGNSSASVGIEAMIQRLETFRGQVSDWIVEYIYKPEARRQGFYNEDAEEEDDELIVPTIKWHKMHLRDLQQDKTFAMQLYEKGLLSAQTMLEIFGYDPDMEIERKRYDYVQMTALGQGFGGQQGGAGGGGGGMPPMGGGGVGGGLDLGGGAGGAPGGEPPISAPGGGGDAGGAPAGGAGGGAPVVTKSSTFSVEVADPGQFGGRVLTKKTRDRLQHEQEKIYNQQQKQQAQVQNASTTMGANGEQRDEKGRIVFTKPERQLIECLVKAQQDGLLTYGIQPQFRVQVGGMEYPLDFAIPDLKIGLEADGEVFHSAPTQVQKDQERDMKLTQSGWTIMRFTDKEIEKQPQQVVGAVIKMIMKKEQTLKNFVNKTDQVREK